MRAQGVRHTRRAPDRRDRARFRPARRDRPLRRPGAAGSRPPARKQPVSSGRPDLRRRCAAGVNTASQCGYMPQCEALEALLPEYRSKGFVVLGFPSGDFRRGIRRREASARRARLWREIPDVREGARVGRPGHAAVQATRSRRCGAPRWDFHRYLIGRDGRLIASLGSRAAPDERAWSQPSSRRWPHRALPRGEGRDAPDIAPAAAARDNSRFAPRSRRVHQESP